MKLSTLIWAGAALRLLLLLWGEAQDSMMEVKYTDIDYKVFSDAATLMSQSQSPFERKTYRYSPLLAFVLLPNVWLISCWGKLLFCAGDVLVAWMTAHLLQLQGVAHQRVFAATALWLFNPFTFTISTRGSCDVLVVVMLLAVLLALLRGHNFSAALLYGLAVHFRIYPIIYAPSIVLYLARTSGTTAVTEGSNATRVGIRASGSGPTMGHLSIRAVLWHGISFGLLSGGTFVLLGLASYGLYGQTFLQEAFLYHLTRRDPRHNFSPYFYPIYLYSYSNAATTTIGGPSGSWIGAEAAVSDGGGESGDDTVPQATAGFDVAAVSFAPPALLLLMLAVRLHRQLPLCWMLQTMVFVAFNKVVTAQYFVWYFSLLPLLMPHMHWPPSRGLKWGLAAWVLTQLHWLGWAYLLEFKGLPIYLYLWAAGLLFLLANAHLIVQLMLCSRDVTFQQRPQAQAQKHM